MFALAVTALTLAGPTCQTFNATDFTGDDIKVGTSTTATECCTECSLTPGCAAWTLWSGGPTCYLKKDNKNAHASVGHISGLVDNPMPPGPAPGPKMLQTQTDCLMRSVIVEYAHSINPNIGAPEVAAMIDALQGDPMMGSGCVVVAPPERDEKKQRRAARARTPSADGVQFFADAVHGDDSNPGTLAAPFKTVAKAVAAVRAAGKGAGGTATLRAGVFHMAATLELSAADSGLTIETHAPDAPAIAYLSGAQPLTGVAWTRVPSSAGGSGANVWSANLSASHPGAASVSGLRWNGRRYWQARYPNGDPERSMPFNDDTIVATGWHTTPGTFPPVKTYAPTTPCASRNTTAGADKTYHMTMGGSACAKYTPPISYYCGGSNDAGGAVDIPATSLPHQPYAHGAAGATVTAMHGGRWCSFAYGVEASARGYAWNAGRKTGTFTFDKGGQQCNRPEGSHGQLIVENVLDELDEEGEFHWDAATKTLTLWHNASAGTPPPSDGTLELVTSLSVLINATGTQSAPVRDLTISNVGFRDTAPTVWAPHVAPTAGDWAVNRYAALSVTGAESLTVSHAKFWRLGNAGVFLGGYHRNATIADSEFAWLGESGIVSVGDTQGVGLDASLYPGFGCDGSAGNQPRGTAVLRNFARELGVINKQSAFYFQAATSSSHLEGNVVFNSARSGVNFNDGFGGGSTVTRNVMFNLNRETADHGPFNSWDRLPFAPMRDAAHRDLIELNLILSNYNSYNGLDTDDDSAYFHMLNNVLVYGHMLKSDFSGHSIEFDGDLGIFVGQSNQYQPVPTEASLLNVLHNTVVYTANDGDNLFGLSPDTCASALNGSATDFPNVYDTLVYSPSGRTTLCHGQSLATYQAKGKLVNVTTAKLPANASSIVAAARRKLLLDI